jgi:hypothetical protein
MHLNDYILSFDIDDFDLYLVENNPILSYETLTFSLASQHSRWIEVMNDEMASIYKNQTWSLVPLPSNKKPISAKWIYCTKPGLHDGPPRLKARLSSSPEGTSCRLGFRTEIWNRLRRNFCSCCEVEYDQNSCSSHCPIPPQHPSP